MLSSRDEQNSESKSDWTRSMDFLSDSEWGRSAFFGNLLKSE